MDPGCRDLFKWDTSALNQGGLDAILGADPKDFDFSG
jgi:hypothetical protein